MRVTSVKLVSVIFFFFNSFILGSFRVSALGNLFLPVISTVCAALTAYQLKDQKQLTRSQCCITLCHPLLQCLRVNTALLCFPLTPHSVVCKRVPFPDFLACLSLLNVSEQTLKY